MIENPVFVYIDDDPISCRVMDMILRRGMQYEHVTIMQDSTDFMDRIQMCFSSIFVWTRLTALKC
jgi:hypothetical protein